MSLLPFHNLTSTDLRAARRAAVQFLYQLEVTEQPFASESMFETFCSQVEIEAGLRAYVHSLVNGVLSEKVKLDAQIEKHLKNWKMSRVAKVDLCILRVCLYELSVRSDVSREVIIADAAEIGKLFGSENTSGFVNGVLDNAAKDFK